MFFPCDRATIITIVSFETKSPFTQSIINEYQNVNNSGMYPEKPFRLNRRENFISNINCLSNT